jgi:catalase
MAWMAAEALHSALSAAGAVPRYIGPRLGAVRTQAGRSLQVEVTLETMPGVLFDALAIPGGEEAVRALANVGPAADLVKEQYRHAKPILALGAGADLVASAGVRTTLPSGAPDPGLLVERDASAKEVLPRFVKAIARHRHHEREVDPPVV